MTHEEWIEMSVALGVWRQVVTLLESHTPQDLLPFARGMMMGIESRIKRDLPVVRCEND